MINQMEDQIYSLLLVLKNKGDEQLIDEIFNLANRIYLKRLVAYVHYMGLLEDECHDVVQNVLTEFLLRVRSRTYDFHSSGKFEAYLFTVTKNQALKYLRDNKKHRDTFILSAPAKGDGENKDDVGSRIIDSEDSFAKHLNGLEIRNLFEICLQKLSRKLSVVLDFLMKTDGKPTKEEIEAFIAQEKITEKAYRKRVERVKDDLVERMPSLTKMRKRGRKRPDSKRRKK
ncbi:MAG TPA: sigma-70 family RNA polymerase sigma factor [Bacteroidia bacterium]|nr:sigma-70 family RNA polymerase sigma factor [Bacteroidia bacterium]